MKNLIPLLLIPLAFAGCKEEDTARVIPDPIPLSEEAAGYYCQMIILEHEGPKGQIFLAGHSMPLWFSQVRDGLAYVKSPEQSADMLVFYVSDMGAAQDWTIPGAENWIDAREAFFVVGSDAIGGMGAPEMVPFATAKAAGIFADNRGGKVMVLDEIPIETVLAPLDIDTAVLEGGE